MATVTVDGYWMLYPNVVDTDIFKWWGNDTMNASLYRKKNGIAIASDEHRTVYQSGKLKIKAARVEDADHYECLNIDDNK